MRGEEEHRIEAEAREWAARMPAPRRRAEHVVLASVDALRPEFYGDETWPAPTLQQLSFEGVRADGVRTVFPALTYPAHTTLVTGALPARHGVTSNRPFLQERRTDAWLWEASHIRVPTLWDAVRSAGGTVAAVGWPVTVGAAIDWNVPDVWPEDYPRGDFIGTLRAAVTPPGLLEELEREATGRLRGADFGLGWLAREDRVGSMASYLFERYRPTLLLMHLIGTDHMQHERGRNNPLTRRAVGAADRAVGQVVGTVERLEMRDRVAFVVVGDHGSINRHSQLRPNAWLVQAGLMEDREDRGEWRAAFHAEGGSAFLRLRDGMGGDVAGEVRRVVEARPPAVRRLFRVIERAELDALGADPGAAFALAAVPGVEFSDRPGPPDVQPVHGATHGYHPDEPEMRTGLVGAGAGFRSGAAAPLLPIECVAPTVAALLGIPFDAPDGMVFPGLLSDPAA
ncbi:MAG TPA: ectonucleotide pyrophosphatase/phosphodiesterase [Longimicrobium sp.]|nr:ectonucleotide pyrophosphatase/phosphodiesterase [Longimicrobium sp.]